MTKLHMNTYVSITLWFHDKDSTRNQAYVYTSVANVKLNQHLWVDYKQGKHEMARLMLLLGKQPTVRRYEDAGGFTVYDLHGFLD